MKNQKTKYTQIKINYNLFVWNSSFHNLTKDLYSLDKGRRRLDTFTLFKIVILSFLTGKNSIRATLGETKVNMAYRWFLNISLTGKAPKYSTFSQNYIRRYEKSSVFKKIFEV